MNALTQSSFVRLFNDFLYKPAYFLLVGLLTVFANVFGAELFTYTCFVLIAIYLCVFGRDLLPIMPLVICSYIAPSRGNNPGRNTASVFSFENGGLYMLILVGLLLAALIYRLIRDADLGKKQFWKTKRKLLPGMLVLCGAYLLSGIGSAQWNKVAGQNLLFAFVQSASILLLYFLLTGLVNWEKAPKGYLAWTGMCIGYVLLAELVYIYLRYGIIINGVIQRSAIYSGWGHYNNIGALLAIMIPFPFFLTGKGRTGMFYLSGMLFLAGVLFTCSRGSILCGVVTYLTSYTISLLHSRHARANATIHILSVLALTIVFAIFYQKLLYLFQALLGRGMDPAERVKGYIAGWKQFLEHPVLGGTFYPIEEGLYEWSSSPTFKAFFPARWHNTVIQLLASCGIAGLAAYSYHRIQTLMLFFRRFSGKKMFALVSMLTLLVTSLLDCHFFNVGPVLFYSMMLAFVEKRLDG
ncbi:MAG: hypothetical protein E7462_02850 [Ruminococcaceae bacterium]|nr:hypothetical protein [Oscillospiraceae bacterium]